MEGKIENAVEPSKKRGVGRPPGAANLVTRQMRELMMVAAEDNYDKFVVELQKLSGEKFVNAYLAMCKFVLPQLQSVNLKDVTPERRSITLKLQALSEGRMPKE